MRYRLTAKWVMIEDDHYETVEAVRRCEAHEVPEVVAEWLSPRNKSINPPHIRMEPWEEEDAQSSTGG